MVIFAGYVLLSKFKAIADTSQANILADNDWHAVLSDFGLTVFGDATVATHTSNPHGSIRWMAPELLNPEIFDMERFLKTQASDVYAFACVCLEVSHLSMWFRTSHVSSSHRVFMRFTQGIIHLRKPPMMRRLFIELCKAFALHYALICPGKKQML